MLVAFSCSKKTNYHYFQQSFFEGDTTLCLLIRITNSVKNDTVTWQRIEFSLSAALIIKVNYFSNNLLQYPLSKRISSTVVTVVMVKEGVPTIATTSSPWWAKPAAWKKTTATENPAKRRFMMSKDLTKTNHQMKPRPPFYFPNCDRMGWWGKVRTTSSFNWMLFSGLPTDTRWSPLTVTPLL